MVKGKFITLEGGEGVGKTTNLEFIKDYLARRNLRSVVTREPGGTPLGEAIRGLLLGAEEMGAEAELLLLFAARAQHVEQVIRPALEDGTWVICDRFTDASYAYQGGGRGIDEGIIASLESWVQRGIRPDLTFLLDAPVETGLARARSRGNADRFEAEIPVFFTRIRQVYLDLARKFPARIKAIDATQSLEEVRKEMGRHLDAFLQE
jgi:dTMP kinase